MAITAAEALAANIRNRRAGAGRSQAELADAMRRLGHRWNRATVAAVEGRARSVSAEELLALALVFGAQLGELLDTGDEDLDVGVSTPVPAMLARLWVRSLPVLRWDGRQLMVHAVPAGFVDYLRWAWEQGKLGPFGAYAVEEISGVEELARRQEARNAAPPIVDPEEGRA
jgi:transcriptional regulator with XRE-family HTH domain